MKRVKAIEPSKARSKSSVDTEHIIIDHDVTMNCALLRSGAPILTPWFTNEGNAHKDLHWRLCIMRGSGNQRNVYIQASLSHMLQRVLAMPDDLDPPKNLLTQTKKIMVSGCVTFSGKSLRISHDNFITAGRLYGCSDCIHQSSFTSSGSGTFSVHIEYLSPAPQETSSASQDIAHSRLARENLTSALKDRLFTDVVLEVGPMNFKAHRVVLAASSPVFKAMFQNECKEKRDGVVKMEGVREEVLRAALNYLYSGDVDTTVDSATHQELLVFADRYEVGPLMAACVETLLKDTCSDTLQLLLLADATNSLRLKEHMLGRFKRHPMRKELLTDACISEIGKTRPELLAELLKVLL